MQEASKVIAVLHGFLEMKEKEDHKMRNKLHIDKCHQIKQSDLK